MENQFGLKILKSLNILYLEDEDNIRENVSKVLSFICKNVYSARNVNEALEFFKNEQIDIILSDISMPELSGIDFVKMIRSNNKIIPIIFNSKYRYKLPNRSYKTKTNWLFNKAFKSWRIKECTL